MKSLLVVIPRWVPYGDVSDPGPCHLDCLAQARRDRGVPGKSSYIITLAFADGQSLKDGAGYVEAGYLITETIAESEVKTEYTSLRYRP